MLKYIPTLNQSGSSNSPETNNTGNLNPDDWTTEDVAKLFTLSDCTAYGEAFASKEEPGKR